VAPPAHDTRKLVQIGNVNIEQPVILAPMEDVTDRAFRLICKQMGADVVYTEFVSSEAISRKIPGALSKMAFGDEERPFGIQIFGNHVERLFEAANSAAQMRPDIIDINFGCPAKKIAAGGETDCAGSGLLRYPDLMEQLTTAVVDAAQPFGIPVTAKTRLGWDADDITILDTVRRLERSGVAALTIHARTRQQMFHGRADWTWIRRAKEVASIPVLGNGDVSSAEDVRRMFEETGVDGVMIGRAAIGNPWIFRRAKELARTGIVPPEPSVEERLEVYLRHLHLAMCYKGERGVRETRKHVKRYVAGFRGASDIRVQIMAHTDPEAIRGLLSTHVNFVRQVDISSSGATPNALQA